MWGDCYWKRQFSECYSPTLLLIGDLHCHLTEVTNKGRPLPLPLLDQQDWYFTVMFKKASHLFSASGALVNDHLWFLYSMCTLRLIYLLSLFFSAETRIQHMQTEIPFQWDFETLRIHFIFLVCMLIKKELVSQLVIRLICISKYGPFKWEKILFFYSVSQRQDSVKNFE